MKSKKQHNGNGAPNLITADPAFGDLSELRRCYGIRRSTAYDLLRSGEIKSRFVAGRRYIDFNSVRELFEQAPSRIDPTLSKEMRRRRHSAAAANGISLG